MNAVEIALLVEELKSLHVPGDAPGIRHDLGSGMEAIRPFVCSSKSLVSSNGRSTLACLNAFKVNFEGAFPLGWKRPAKGAAAP
jgi:hypothetical protein